MSYVVYFALMRIPRVYINEPLAPEQKINLDQKTSHYLCQVLRLRNGQALFLFNGDGYEYTAEMINANKKQSVVSICQIAKQQTKPHLYIHLGLAISKGDRLDLAIQKAVELGVDKISVLKTEFNAVKLNAERLQKKQSHWRGVAIAACEQSGRCYVPEIPSLQNLNTWLNQTDEALKLLLSPRGDKSLNSFTAPQRLQLLTGPEGGLSDAEEELARQHGFKPIRLGKLILRTETAPLAAIAAAQALWGDFR